MRFRTGNKSQNSPSRQKKSHKGKTDFRFFSFAGCDRFVCVVYDYPEYEEGRTKRRTRLHHEMKKKKTSCTLSSLPHTSLTNFLRRRTSKFPIFFPLPNAYTEPNPKWNRVCVYVCMCVCECLLGQGERAVARARRRREAERDGDRYVGTHPEEKEREKFLPPFGKQEGRCGIKGKGNTKPENGLSNGAREAFGMVET